jgi:hypothetical protein
VPQELFADCHELPHSFRIHETEAVTRWIG